MKRFKGVLQHDKQDCGAACLCTILKYFGTNIPLSLIKDEMKIDKTGSNFYNISLIAKNYGLKSNALNGTFEELIHAIKIDDVNLPFIAHIDGHSASHFIVVYKIYKKKLKIFDPKIGKQVITFKKFNEKWSGSILTFKKKQDFIKIQKKNVAIFQIKNILLKEKRYLLFIILYSLIISIISMVGSFFYKNIIDNVLSDPEKNITIGNMLSPIIKNTYLLLILLLFLYFFQLLISILNGFTLSKISEKVNYKLMDLFFTHTISLPLEFIHRMDSGNIISRFHSIGDLQTHSIRMIFSIILDSLMAIVGAIILFMINPLLFIIILIIVICYCLLTFLFINPLKIANQNIQKEHSNSVTTINEIIDGLATIKMQLGEIRFVHKFQHTIKRISKNLFNMINLKSILDSLVVFIESFGLILTIWLGSKLVINGTITLGSLVAFQSLAVFFIVPVKNIINTMSEIQSTIISVKRLDDILSIKSEQSLDHYKENFFPDNKIVSIKLDSASYSYNLINMCISNINLTLESGNFVGILGQNGSGKSTLLKLISSLISPKEGKIYFNDIESSQIPLPNIRNRLAYIDQNPYVFEGTLKDNLTLGNTDFIDEDVSSICQIFNLFELTPDGNDLDFLIFENGENLSGGQRQKISFARAILSKPDVILLDEATNGLDKNSEAKVFEYLHHQKNNLIIVSIFHDSSLLKFVDRIITLEKGRIIFDGDPKHLSNKVT